MARKTARKTEPKTPRRARPDEAERRAVELDSRPNQKKVNVFISYARADNSIATLLREEITDINRDRIECFLDTETIESGEGWEKKLEGALNSADWLVCIYTGDQSDFCGYEIGVFTQGKVLAKSERTSRLVCLHDVEDLPIVFRAHQNRYIELPSEPTIPSEMFDETKFYERSGLFKFFEDFCRYENLYVARTDAEAKRKSQTLVRKAKLITEAFRTGRDTDIYSDIPTQLGIEVTVPAKPGERLQAIPSSAQVKGTFESFKLFDLMPPRQGEQMPSTSWGELKAERLWIERLERDMLNAANGRALGEAESVFRSNDKIYRAVLHHHIRYWNGAHLFGIIFVETLLPQFIGDQNTSLVLLSLLLATRFRSLYFDNFDRTMAKFADTVSDTEFQGNYWQFLEDLNQIREQAKDQAFDSKAFIESFGESRKGLAESFVQAGNQTREALEASLPDRTTPVNAENGRRSSN
jgi:TIR domain